MKVLLALALMVALLVIGKSVHADKLHSAAAAGDVTRIQTMLKAGANVNAEDKEGLGLTALHYAAGYGHAAAIEVLLKAGANVHAKDKYAGKTPLHIAAFWGHAAAIEVLLKAGANVHSKSKDSKDGQTALDYAASRGHAAAIDILLKARANVNPKSKGGWTPLHYAARDGHAAAIEVLLRAGANVDAKDNVGKTAFDVAAANGHAAAVREAVENAKVPLENTAAAGPLGINMGEPIKPNDGNGWTAQGYGLEGREYKGSLGLGFIFIEETRKGRACSVVGDLIFSSRESALSGYKNLRARLVRKYGEPDREEPKVGLFGRQSSSKDAQALWGPKLNPDNIREIALWVIKEKSGTQLDNYVMVLKYFFENYDECRKAKEDEI